MTLTEHLLDDGTLSLTMTGKGVIIIARSRIAAISSKERYATVSLPHLPITVGSQPALIGWQIANETIMTAIA